LAPLLEKLDFNDKECINYQIEAIFTIRTCLNFISSHIDGKEYLIPDRVQTGSVGEFSTNGQGDSSVCASVFGAYLYHFGNCLGIDVKYRAGVRLTGK
jgi:hypothetical protein